MRIQHNITALNSYRQLGINNSNVAKNLEKLSSGYKINRAGDDAAGLAISEKMRAQIAGLQAAEKNANDGISLIQTAEGNLQEVHSMLNRMVELATMAANGTYEDTNREQYQKEINALNEEIDRISKSANFNGKKLLDGTLGLNTQAFSIGEGSAAAAGQAIELSAAFPAEGTNNATLHLGTENVAQTVPSFSIDLGDLKFADDANGATDIKVKVEGLGGAISIETDALSQTAGGLSTEKIAEELANKFNDESVGGVANAGKKVTIGGQSIYLKAEASGTSIKFTYLGNNATADDATADDVLTADQVTAINGVLSSTVTVNVTGTDIKGQQGDAYHNTFNVVNAVEAKTGARAGIDFTMTADMIADGNRLTIEDHTFIFKDSDTDYTAGDNETVIDVSGFTTDAEKLQQAIDKMSQVATSNFQIEAKSGSVLHIEQTTASTEVYDTYESLTGQFSLKGADTGATTKLSILDNSKITEGNSVNIDGKEYKFGEGGVAIGDTAADTLNNLKAALEAEGYTATITDSTIEIEAKDAAAEAPVVLGKGLSLQVGDTNETYQKMGISIDSTSAASLGVADVDVSTEESAGDAIAKINAAIDKVSDIRAGLGALQNRLDHTINNLGVATENITAAESRIRDTDMAEEMMNFTKNNILTQAAQAMLAQANMVPQSVLQLLQ